MKDRYQGINVPLFSIHTQKSCGIGEYLDLLPLISWCKSIGLGVIQLLPLNDTGTQNSPYSAISAFSLNPVHLSLHALPDLNHNRRLEELRKLNRTQLVDYETVRAEKELILREYFDRHFSTYKNDPSYQIFIENNHWVESYAVYKSLLLRHPNAQNLMTEEADSTEVAYHIFVQYLCHQQMREVKKAAEQADLLLKGDIPIMIAEKSVDVWGSPSLFLHHSTAGAIPDQYTPEGQDWGFPLYNWENCFDEILDWWKKRLKIAENFYHLYRLDHIPGFFRIWAIPKGKKASEGNWYPKDPKKWRSFGKRALEFLLKATSMKPIGEDLGIFPPLVHETMEELNIPGTKLLRYERVQTSDYPKESLTTISTHDGETAWNWWSKFPNQAMDFAKLYGIRFQSKMDKDLFQKILSISHMSNSRYIINLLHEYFYLVDGMCWEQTDDRINYPGEDHRVNWRYRFKPSVEEICESHQLRELFRL